MSRTSDQSLTTQFRGSTAPTPGFRRATPEPATSESTHNDRQPVPSSTEVESLGRGGSHHGTQGCPHSIAYRPDKVTATNRSPRHHATNGNPADLSLQPRGPANLRGTLNLSQTRTTVASHNMSRSTHIDRSACPGWPDAKGNPRHGNRQATKRFGCRCPDALEAERIYSKRHRHGLLTPRRIPSTGTVRRLQALAVMGHSLRVLSEPLGMTRESIYSLRAPRYSTILADKAKQIAELYDELHLTPATGPNVRRTQTNARKAGWAHPFAWDDNIDDPQAKPLQLLEGYYYKPSVNEEEVDMQILLSGHVRHPERFETPEDRWRWRNLLVRAVHTLAARGLSLEGIGVRLKISERQVVRLKKIDDDQLCRSTGFNKREHVETTPSTSTSEEAQVA